MDNALSLVNTGGRKTNIYEILFSFNPTIHSTHLEVMLPSVLPRDTRPPLIALDIHCGNISLSAISCNLLKDMDINHKIL